MRRTILAIGIVAASVFGLGFGLLRPSRASNTPPSNTAASRTATARRVRYYVDPMHPSYKSDKPGIAPDCGMKLEPVYAPVDKDDPGEPSTEPVPAQSADGAIRIPAADGAVRIDESARSLYGIRFAAAAKGGIDRAIHASGRVAVEDTRVYRVNSGVDGFIRQTLNDSVGMLVSKNQKLAAYYAPEFIAAASGFLAANERVPGSVTKEGARSIQNYTDRLRNLGMSDVQIRQVAESRQLPESIDVISPVDGFVIARNISAGQHFDHGMEFYRIADLSKVWVIAEVNEKDASALRAGAAAEVTLRTDGRRLPARVTDSLPQSDADGGTVKVRLEVENRSFLLRPEMLLDVDFSVHAPAAVTVPLDAVIESGSRAIVYVGQERDMVKAREVQTGRWFGDTVEILRGITAGERVVVSGTFLVDSETRLKTPLTSSTERADAAR